MASLNSSSASASAVNNDPCGCNSSDVVLQDGVSLHYNLHGPASSPHKLILIMGLLTVFHWSPPVTYTSFFEAPLQNLSQLIWPAMAVGYRYAAVVARMVRSSVLEVLREDYIRTARAKGVFERLVVARHAMRNALLPAITVIGLEFAFLIGGLVVTEQVFNLNGIGRLFVDAVTRSDFVLVQALVMLLAVVFVTMNLVVDMLYGVLDPRVRQA